MGRITCSIIVIALLGLLAEAGNRDDERGRGQLYVFGDSNVDIGNIAPGPSHLSAYWRLPYGTTWPGEPFGRFSDGHLFSDVFASYLEVETPVTFRSLNVGSRVLAGTDIEVDEAKELNGANATKRGINFAYVGSGVLFLTDSLAQNVSVQIEFLRTTINRGIVSTQDLAISTALLSVSGDYSSYHLLHPNMEGVEDFIPLVAAEIANAAKELSDFGFRSVVVTLLEPYGCLPIFTYATNNSQCDDIVNSLAAWHNSLLTTHIFSLQDTLPSTTFIILDFYNAIEAILNSGMFMVPLRPCCVGISGGRCGVTGEKNEPQYTLCSNRDEYLFWDNFHLTDAGWTALSNKLFPSSRDISNTRELSHAKSSQGSIPN